MCNIATLLLFFIIIIIIIIICFKCNVSKYLKIACPLTIKKKKNQIIHTNLFEKGVHPQLPDLPFIPKAVLKYHTKKWNGCAFQCLVSLKAKVTALCLSIYYTCILRTTGCGEKYVSITHTIYRHKLTVVIWALVLPYWGSGSIKCEKNI